MVLSKNAPKPLQPVIHPSRRFDITLANTHGVFTTPAFRDDVVAERLAGAVKIPTVTYDGMGRVGEDERWEVFGAFPRYLEETFPLIYEKVEVATVNEYGLLYTWRGSESSSKPLLLMAHYDVVPAPESTSDRWTYPPFSGHYDGEFIWGRGSEDDKSNLIAMLTAIDSLLTQDFEPRRTVVLSVGFDEEGGAGQSYGARCLADHLLEEYGPDGIELILDEGIAGIDSYFGTDFALPATAEKGYMDVTITVDTAGGHSSTPPDYTAIGYLARAVQAVEDSPFSSRLTSKNPTTSFLNRAALYSRDMPDSLRSAILDPMATDRVLEYMNSTPELRALVRTSTAVDIIHGGEKANALPETAHAVVNHRIAVEDSVQVLKDHYIRILTPIATKWNLSLNGFGTGVVTAADPTGTIVLSASDALEPSPVSDPRDARFGWLTGTLRAVFGKDVVVAPVLLTGNTDTKFFWDLSTQIYRFSPWRQKLDPRGSRMHTVDERMPVEGLMEMVKFYHEFIRVLDERRR